MAGILDFAWGAAGASFAAAEALAQDKPPEEVLTAAKRKLDEVGQGDDKAQAVALLAAAYGYIGLGIVEKAVATALDARRLLKEAGSSQEELQVFLLAAAVQVQGGRAEEAVHSAGEAQALAQQRGDAGGEASARRLLARAQLALGRLGEALREATAAAALSKAADDRSGQASACVVAALAQGSAPAAMALAAEAVALSRAAGDRRSEAEGLRASAEVQIASGDGAGALAASTEAAKAAAEAKDDAGRAHSLCLEARARSLQGDAAAGLKAARAALALFRQTGDGRGVQLARDLCTSLRGNPSAGPSAPAAAAPAAATAGAENWVNCTRVVGIAESKRLAGMVAVVTGGSRGVGKGTAQMLASSGATVYVTGRAAGDRPADAPGPGSAAETAGALAKLGGAGVAVHADHTKSDNNQALVDVVAKNHGRLDILVNNAPAGDQAAQGEQFAPCLRRGRGLVVDVTGRGGAPAAAGPLRDGSTHHIAMTPGLVKSERSMASAQQVGARLVDMESTRLSGQAVAGLAAMGDAELSRFAGTHRALCTAEAARFELDGYSHEAEAQTFSTFARTPLVV